MFSSLAPPRLKMSSSVKLVVDGNSIAQGAYASDNAHRWGQVMRTLAPAINAGSYVNVAVSGQSWANMDGVSDSFNASASAADVDGAFDNTKTCVLILWETTNTICNQGRSLSQAQVDTSAYIQHRLALNPWKILIVGTIPRQAGGAFASVYGSSIPAMNAVLDQYDAWMAGNWKALGCKGFVSMRPPGGPFTLPDYSTASFAAAAGFYNEANPSMTHPNDAGYAFAAAVINAALMRLLR